jgi:hypothetical protein
MQEEQFRCFLCLIDIGDERESLFLTNQLRPPLNGSDGRHGNAKQQQNFNSTELTKPISEAKRPRLVCLSVLCLFPLHFQIKKIHCVPLNKVHRI